MILHAENRRWSRKTAPIVLLGVAVIALGGVSQPQRGGASLKEERASDRPEALLFQKIGEIEREVATRRKAAVVYPKYAQAHSDLGIVLESLGNVARAEEAYKIALAFQPQLGAAHTNLALLYEKAGRIDQAGEHWGARVKLGPVDDPWVLTARERLRKYRLPVPQTEEELAQKRAAQVRLSVQEGRRHYDAKAWDAAADAFERALEMEPHHSEAARLLHKAGSKAQRVRQARIETIQRAHAQAKREAAEHMKRQAQETVPLPVQRFSWGPPPSVERAPADLRLVSTQGLEGGRAGGAGELKASVRQPPQPPEVRLAAQRAEAEAKARALRREMEEQVQTERALLERKRSEEFLKALERKRAKLRGLPGEKVPPPTTLEVLEPSTQQEEMEPVRLSPPVQPPQAKEPPAQPEPTLPSEALESAQTLARSLAEERARARERTFTELYQRGVAAMRKGRYEEAATLFEQVLTLRPDHRQARQGLERVRKALAQAKRAARR